MSHFVILADELLVMRYGPWGVTSRLGWNELGCLFRDEMSRRSRQEHDGGDLGPWADRGSGRTTALAYASSQSQSPSLQALLSRVPTGTLLPTEKATAT